MAEKIVLFDGVCNLCSASVQFVIRHDKKGQFQFASLQSDTGKALLEKHGIDPGYLTSLAFIDKEKVYTESTGALRIAKYLDGIWPALYGLMIFPRFIRNTVYRWIARKRYQWFGKKEACWVPTSALRARFLD